MSKLAKKPIVIPEGVQVNLADGVLNFSGKEGKLELKVLPYTAVEIKDNQIIVASGAEHKQARANWGTMAALIKTKIEGVAGGFGKVLELEGIGFRATMDGKNLVLNVGFSHPVKYAPPADIKVVVEKNTIKISGADKALVGEVAAQIRRIWPPEPYQGKGIRYKGEVVRRKAGKKVAGTGASAA